MFGSLAPAGFYIAIRVGFAFPMVEHNHLPASWVREYGTSGLIVHDPAMAWAYKHCGVARCSALGEEDTQGVLELAKNHGLNFGAVASCVDEGDASQRTFGFFFRSDREYESRGARAPEHVADRGSPGACPAQEAYRCRNRDLEPCQERAPDERDCLHLGISESAIKQRLKNARLKLNAKTGPQAAATATMLGVI